MNKTILIIFKILVPAIIVGEFILVIAFIDGYLNYCSSFKDMMDEIIEELGLGHHEGEDKSAIRPFEKVFCTYTGMATAFAGIGTLIVIFINIIILISLFIAFICALISVFKISKCCLICAMIFSLCSDVIVFIDLIIGLSQDETLESYGTISDELIKKVDEALTVVKKQKRDLILYSTFSIVFSILTAIGSGILISLFNKEEQNKQMEQFYKLNNNQNNMQQNLAQFNYNNNDNKNYNNTPIIQENLIHPNNN